VDEDRSGADGPALPGDLLAVDGFAPDDGHRRAPLGEHDRGGGADAAGTTEHHGRMTRVRRCRMRSRGVRHAASVTHRDAPPPQVSVTPKFTADDIGERDPLLSERLLPCGPC